MPAGVHSMQEPCNTPTCTTNSAGTRRNMQAPEEAILRATSPEQLGPESWGRFLSKVGCLFGIRIDDNNAPRRSHFPAASPKPNCRVCLQETNEVETEVIATQNERETNYVLKGWSLSAISPSSPWTLLRIANNNQANRCVPSVTKRIIVQRALVEISPDDISPTSEFESDVRAALEKPTRAEKFQALYRVFGRWGDVIPLVFHLGISLSITDVESNVGNSLNKISSVRLGELVEHPTVKVSIQGGDANAFHEGLEKWLYSSGTVPVARWSQIRVVQVSPITTLLPTELQTQLSQLYHSLITYNPPSLIGDAPGGRTLEDSHNFLKTIKSVTVRYGSYVNSLGVTYLDGTSSTELGGTGASDRFDLNPGEYISEFTVWTGSKGVYALQFVTTAGRTSRCYGGSGTPTVIKGNGGLLTAFTTKVKEDILYDLQGVWRHDIQYTEPSREMKYSEYFGGTGGCSFNDFLLLKHSGSLRLSSIRVKCWGLIDGIQLTYDNEQGGQIVRSEGSYYGGPGGPENTFSLAPGEYITDVTGKHGAFISQLRFKTNLGRTSNTFGGNDGNEFWSGAPLTSNGGAMRLHSICGRSGKYLNGIVFVWAPV